MSETSVITGKVRFSYANVFKARAHEEGQDPKFSVSLIISKDDKLTLKRVEDAIEAAKKEGVTKFSEKVQTMIKSKKTLPAKFWNPLRDGDEEREDNEEYQGAMFLNASSKNKPGLVGIEVDPEGKLVGLEDEKEFYSGCFGRASLNFYAFNSNGNQGVGCGLNNLQKLEDGERLGGGGASAQDDFGDDDGLL